MEPQRFLYNDIGRGLNEGLPASEIADGEVTSLENFFPFGRKLIRRNGLYALHSTAYSEGLTGVFSYDVGVYEPTTILGTTSGLAKLSSGDIVALANLGTPFGPSDMPWTMLQYKNIGYAIREFAGLRRFDSVGHGDAGITAPETAPVLAEGAAGVLTAAEYHGVVTFVNLDTGAESNPSEEGTVTITASKKIEWSSIAVSTNAQVGGRRLYRTLPDQQGVYLFVAQIDDNTTTTYSDDIAIADMGDFVSFDNDIPPSTLRMGDIWQERLFASDGLDLFYSEPFLPESFAADSVIRVFPDDGHAITAIHADGARLIVGKRNKTHVLTAAGSGFALETLSDKHGVASHHSIKSAEGQLLWFGGDSFYRSFGGGQPESIATVKIKDILSRINPERYQYAVSAIFPKYSWYLTSLSIDDSLSNNIILCYNYKSDAWATFTFPSAPSAIAEVFDEAGSQILYSVHPTGFLYEMERGNTDFGHAITAFFKTKSYRWNQLGLLTCVRRFFLACTNVPDNTATLVLHRNQQSGSVKTRTGLSLYHSDPIYGEPLIGWVGVNTSTLGTPGVEWQAEFFYTAPPPLEIEGWGFEILPLARKVRIQ